MCTLENYGDEKFSFVSPCPRTADKKHAASVLWSDWTFILYFSISFYALPVIFFKGLFNHVRKKFTLSASYNESMHMKMSKSITGGR